MALRGAGKQAISNGMGELVKFTQGNVSGAPVHDYSTPSMGRLPNFLVDQLRAGIASGSVDYIVWSYWTPIAWHHQATHDEPGRWFVPDVKYSVTTTQHQNVVRVEADHPGHYQDAARPRRTYYTPRPTPPEVTGPSVRMALYDAGLLDTHR